MTFFALTAQAETVHIAGASGATCRHLIRQLIETDYDVRGLTRDPIAAQEKTSLDME